MNDYRTHVEAAIRATVFHSPTSYSWFGRPAQQLSPTVKRALTTQTARSYLLFLLQSQLYTDLYCQGFAAPSQREAARCPGATGMPLFVEQLSAANTSGGYWEGGWDVSSIGEDGVVVRREGLTLWVQPEDCWDPLGGPRASGRQVHLHFPKEFLGLSPGFYMALSDEPFPQDGSPTLVRFYLNLMAEGAVHCMRTITSTLNQAHRPFRLKVLKDPAHFTRCDAGVLYILKKDYGAVAEILERVYPELVASLKRGTPVFTKHLAPGLAFAEDPGPKESFGLHRCRLLADGLIRAYEQRKKSIEQRVQAVVTRFAEDGISLEEPFLNPGSRDEYHFSPQCRDRSHPLRAMMKEPAFEFKPVTFLQMADGIGRHLSREAVWYQDRCNWLGFLPADQGTAHGQPSTTYRAQGADLYAGTSGLALFLGELYAATGEAATRRTALGAIRQALSRVETLPPPARLGLYTGGGGIAFVAARVGTLLNETELLERTVQLLHSGVCEDHGGQEFDLISGRAGAIAALVVLHAILDDASLLEVAVRLGDELLQTAEHTAAGYSWRSGVSPRQRNLTGFSHGTAGVGYSLLELSEVTGDVRYRRAAEGAFEYERHWFDPSAGNWPDFREEPVRGNRNRRPQSFATTWCHGAPGIALSRLRAYELLNEEPYRVEARIALHTTRTTLETWLQGGNGNYSLCHGLAGNAEALLYGAQVFERARSDDARLALAIGHVGIETYARRGRPWPCGVNGGETPGLMLGLAGIGYFYLRLYDPAIPSILILQRNNFG